MAINLNSIFRDHMVFAANEPIRIFGTGVGSVSVRFCGNTGECVSENERWLIELPAMPYGGPYTMEICLDGEQKLLSDIYVGEVLLLAGQSNLQMKVAESVTERHLVETDELLRFFMLERLEEGESIFPDDGWVVCDEKNVAGWSLLGIHIASEIHKRKGVAVGLVGCYQGGSVIESWMPKELCDLPEYCVSLEKKHMDHKLETFSTWNQTGSLYEFMFSKIIPYAFSRVIWYQGESDTTIEEAKVYHLELAALIRRWRSDLASPDIPFTVVQIADYCNRADEAWAEVQKAQLRIAEMLPYVNTVISADLCENTCIHPQLKKKLGVRIADSFIDRAYKNEAEGNGVVIAADFITGKEKN